MVILKDYVGSRIEEISNSRYYECCKKHLLDELLDIINILDKDIQGEIDGIIEEEQSTV